MESLEGGKVECECECELGGDEGVEGRRWSSRQGEKEGELTIDVASGIAQVQERSWRWLHSR